VGRVLDGDRENLRSVEIAAGTLMLFRGHYSLHRVTPVEGTRRRLQLILAYADRPDQQGSAESSRLHYGARAAG
jgi:predicted 2-oxoglutarate/Fe(II)-dependent dioxygenase YbiX